MNKRIGVAGFLVAVLVVGGCVQTTAADEPAAARAMNTLAGLRASIDRIEAVRIVELDGRKVRATLSADEVKRLRVAVGRAAPSDGGLGATPAAWPAVLVFEGPDGRVLVVAHFVRDALRFRSRDPYSRRIAEASGELDPAVTDHGLDADDADWLHEIFTRYLGPTRVKQYLPW